MGEKTELLGIITARGGSKRIPDKNVRELLGKPLIGYVVEAGLKAESISRLIVSTDSENIARVAEKSGAEVPFMRPAELAADETPTLPVLVHALEYLEKKEGYFPEAVVVLQPTSPLLKPRYIDAAWELFREKDARAVLSVSLVEGHPEWFFTMDAGGRMKPLLSDENARRRPSQDLPVYYTLNGAFAVRRASDVMRGEDVFEEGVYGYEIPREDALDIDDMEEFERAEKLLQEARRRQERR